MLSKSLSLTVSPGTVLSVFCLLLYSAGFIRIEVKFNDHEQRLVAVEDVISHIRRGMADASIKGRAVYFHFVICTAFVFDGLTRFHISKAKKQLSKAGSSFKRPKEFQMMNPPIQFFSKNPLYIHVIRFLFDTISPAMVF